MPVHGWRFRTETVHSDRTSLIRSGGTSMTGGVSVHSSMWTCCFRPISWDCFGCSGMPALMSETPITPRVRRSVFGTFGGPHITSLLAEVSGYALRAQWFQQYWLHRALRPEAYGGLVHYTKTTAASYPVHSAVLNSQALAGILEKNNGTYFLPIAFPED